MQSTSIVILIGLFAFSFAQDYVAFNNIRFRSLLDIPYDLEWYNSTTFFVSIGNKVPAPATNLMMALSVTGGNTASLVRQWSSSTNYPRQMSWYNNNLYAIDRTLGICKFTSTGSFIESYDIPDYSSGPEGLEIDEFGNFFFSQVAYDRIVVYDSTGTDTGYRINAPGGSSSWDPWSLYYDTPRKILYVSTRDGIYKYSWNGTDASLLGVLGQSGSTPGSYSYPSDIQMDSQGYLWVCDTYNNRVQRINTTSGTAYEIYDGFTRPYSLVVNDQYLFIGVAAADGGTENAILAYRRNNGMTTGIVAPTPVPPTPAPTVATGNLVTSSTTAGDDNGTIGIIIGVVVGVLVIIAIVLILIYIFVIMPRRYAKTTVTVETGPAASGDSLLLTNVVIGKRIAAGEFGEVFKGSAQGSDVALKKLKNAVQMDDFMKEASILSQLRHPKVVFFLGVFQDTDGSKYIVMEYMSKGSLQDVLRDFAMNDKKLPLLTLLHLCRDAASGMEYLESKEIVHRDLALRNLLVEEKGNNEYSAKITDFGMARLSANYQAQQNTGSNDQIPVKWAAPEVINYGQYSIKSDVWAYGVTVWEIFSYGTQPYPGLSNAETVNKVVRQKYRLPRPQDMPDIVYDLLSLTWSLKPERRPNFHNINEQFESFGSKAAELDKEVKSRPQATPQMNTQGTPQLEEGNNMYNNKRDSKRYSKEVGGQSLYNTDDNNYADPLQADPSYHGQGLATSTSNVNNNNNNNDPPTYSDVGQAPSQLQQDEPVSYVDVGQTAPNNDLLPRAVAQKWEIPYAQLQVGEVIAHGAYGEVHKGRWRETDVSIKIITGASLNNQNMEDFLQEANLMMSLRPHENVILLKGICSSPLCIVTQYLPGGSLAQLVKEKQLEYNVQLHIGLGVAKGLHHLHCEGVVHRDLSARNILLQVVKTGYEPKITNFGLSRFAVTDENTTRSDIGPLKWMAPEVIANKVYSFKSDVWSYGCLLVELFARGELYPGEDGVQVAMQVGKGQKRPTTPDTNQQMIQLIDSCFVVDVSSRPTMEKILQQIMQVQKATKQ